MLLEIIIKKWHAIWVGKPKQRILDTHPVLQHNTSFAFMPHPKFPASYKNALQVAVYNSLDSSLSVFQSHDDERGMLGYQVWCEKLLYVG